MQFIAYKTIDNILYKVYQGKSNTIYFVIAN